MENKLKQKIANSENSSENSITFIEKLDFNDWLKVQWSYQWRNAIKIFLLLFPLIIISIPIFIFLKVNVIGIIALSLFVAAAVFLMLFANSIMLKSLLNVKYDNFKIIVTDSRHNEIKYNELDIISRYSLAWGLVWREFIITIINFIFVIIAIVRITIILLVFKLPESAIDGHIIRWAVISLYIPIGFILNIFLIKQLVKTKFRKFKLAVIKVENPYPVRNIYLTVIIIYSIIGSICFTFLNRVADISFIIFICFKYTILNLPYSGS